MPSDEQTRAVKDINSAVPLRAINSTVAIICTTQAKSVVQLGTGTLYMIGDVGFVVTAAHVITAVKERDGSLGILALKTSSPVALLGVWTLSATDSGKTDNVLDVAVYRLSGSECNRLRNCDFVQLDDIDFTSEMVSGYFALCGFPSVWGKSSDSPSEVMILKPLLYGTWSYSGSVAGLSNFNDEKHLLFQATPETLLDHEGRKAIMRTRSNHWAAMPDSLRGISGCSVWLIGDITVPASMWRNMRPRVVAVETSIYTGAIPAIKATKWNPILSLIYCAFPELKSLIDSHVAMVNKINS